MSNTLRLSGHYHDRVVTISQYTKTLNGLVYIKAWDNASH